LLKALYPDSLYFDLLLFDVYERLQRNPTILRETILASTPSSQSLSKKEKVDY